jgi:acetylornithine deacetylase/succinyl-diaminopimelate desuccinylase-like protein
MNQDNLVEMYLDNTWRPNLSITGADHLPPIAVAGNVLRPRTAVKVSLRLCPAMDAKKAEEILVEKLTKDVPYNAKVTIEGGHAGSGWSMRDLEKNLSDAIAEAGAAFFDGRSAGSYGEGGSIPFLNELGKKFPDSQIVAFGLLGPNSNAHGPNESINLKYAKKLTCSLAHVIASCGSF